ncbi:p-loop containing nucleoside triphosphate hydrolase protein [Moesziomyces antarcticus]|uniref:P-loop containing nucleoside triphosphate hydrolase protein n=1 Tax=Pseudozyma antarctica TaxID=84753 RepID=A0A5C3FJA7_PSEA2|nr:p-loop containing nucleoside triphosphate hydrolase protein [Moesziomyces antarcticus]GAK63675.1 p-loop containing nucleoside triphosphate hydrolase protein [Moesziomyces antarcticus]SPO44270.1 uncharacterized protein PSANT_01955 [Moesziomyces antarcticus]
MSANGATRSTIRAVDVFGQHVVQQLQSFRSRFSGGASIPPLFVAMQGPQGSGKTTVTRALIQYLNSSGLNVGILSTDDLYHTHGNLHRVAQENPTNPLLSGRGQPGTHDTELGADLLDRIYTINSKTPQKVKLPVFDKSLFNGEGDRVPVSDASPALHSRLDVFILEGWSMGFSTISAAEVERKRIASPPDSPLSRYDVEALHQINENLKAYRQWYEHFSVFLQIQPTDLNNVYIWRTQQEHAMKAANGGRGMSDDGVKAFVDRYMPGYYLFLDTIRENEQWKGRSKTITIDLDRTCVAAEDW